MREWTSALVPRYQRRLREVNEAVVATYLAGGNTRRLRGALAPLLKAAPLSKSAVSRVVGTLKTELEAWRTRSLAELDVFGLYLDAIALRVRSAGKVTSIPVLGVVAIPADGQKRLVALELCGGESFEAWKGCLDDLVARGLGAPVVCVIDGHAGLRKAVGLVWPDARVQRCAVRTSFATSSARPRSTPWLRSARTSTGSSTRKAPRRPALPSRSSSGSGERAAPAWSAASRKAARNCSRFSNFPRASGRRSERRT
jgi:transposase-like protein